MSATSLPHDDYTVGWICPLLTHDDYTVGWICPLEVEQAAAEEMLDETHPRLDQPDTDSNSYTLGNIQGHNVVIAGLPTTGDCSTATVVAHMRSTYPSLRFVLLVGIGGGVPGRTDAGLIKLGDVVVSKPTGQHSGAIQYDHGKAQSDIFERIGSLAPPPNVLLGAAHQLGVVRRRAKTDPLKPHLQRIDTTQRGLRQYKYPGKDKDHLYESNYIHADKSLSCTKCGCDAAKRVKREAQDSEDEDEREDEEFVTIHRGTIASGELVMKNGVQRDILAQEYGVLCFENEAAGPLHDLPCLVIRGISDYSDTHRSDAWHGYAAATAAAYARELFFHMPVQAVADCQTVQRYQRARLRDWLRAPDPSTNHNEARESRHVGTGAWFLYSDDYARWKRSSTHSLWLHGLPGCGKTVLSSTVLEDLKKSLATHSVLLYFYFDFKDTQKRSLDRMLRSLLSQIYDKSEASRKYIDQLCSACRDGKEQPKTEDLHRSLTQALEASGDVWILLDALDESDTREELLSWLELSAERQWQLFVTSREEQDISISLRKWIAQPDVVRIQKQPVDDDIRAVVKDMLMNDERFARWRDLSEERTMIENQLIQRAGGSFRMAICQIDSVQYCINRRTLKIMLDNLPRTLEAAYDHIIHSVPEEHRATAVRILQFLAYSERPLLLEELVDIVAVRPDSAMTFSKHDRIARPDEITMYCASLMRIVTRPRDSGETAVVKEVQLAHLSVQEYLTSGRVVASFMEDFQEPRARGCIVRISLAYLHQTMQEQDINDLNERFPFLQYAARHWIDSGPSAEEKVQVRN